MNQDQINEFTAMAKSLESNLTLIMKTTHETINEIAKTDPEKADELLKDLAMAQNAKDMTTINNLMNKYANISK
jgi:DNA-directed RNA polymerase subunit F